MSTDQPAVLIVNRLPLRTLGLATVLDCLCGPNRFRVALTAEDAKRWVDAGTDVERALQGRVEKGQQRRVAFVTKLGQRFCAGRAPRKLSRSGSEPTFKKFGKLQFIAMKREGGIRMRAQKSSIRTFYRYASRQIETAPRQVTLPIPPNPTMNGAHCYLDQTPSWRGPQQH